jgi:hypothetical protein
MILGAITGVPTPACLSAASNPVEAVTPPFGAGTNIALGVQRTGSSIRGAARLCEGDDERACRDEYSAHGLGGGHGFAEEEPTRENNDGHAELVDGGDAADGTHLKGAKVTEPGEAGAEAREDEEDPTAAVDGGEAVVGVLAEGNGPSEEEDDRGSDRGGKIAVDVLDAHFGEESRGGCEDSRKDRPEYPGHGVSSIWGRDVGVKKKDAMNGVLFMAGGQ